MHHRTSRHLQSIKLASNRLHALQIHAESPIALATNATEGLTSHTFLLPPKQAIEWLERTAVMEDVPVNIPKVVLDNLLMHVLPGYYTFADLQQVAKEGGCASRASGLLLQLDFAFKYRFMNASMLQGCEKEFLMVPNDHYESQNVRCDCPVIVLCEWMLPRFERSQSDASD
jgi:hypothetical protein